MRFAPADQQEAYRAHPRSTPPGIPDQTRVIDDSAVAGRAKGAVTPTKTGVGRSIRRGLGAFFMQMERIFASERLNILAFVLLLGVFAYSAVDYAHLIGSEWGPGWDFATNCDAAHAYDRGVNAYLPENYEVSKNYFTYQPALLPVVSALCRITHTHDLRRGVGYWPMYWLLTAFCLTAAVRIARPGPVAGLFCLMTLAGLTGFFWALRTGNYTMFEMNFLLLALAFLARAVSPRARSWDPWMFAVCFGLFAAIKAVLVMFVVVFLLLPFTRRQVAGMAAVAVGISLTPIILSSVFDPVEARLAWHWVLSDQSGCNPSFFCLAKDVGRWSGIAWPVIGAAALALIAVLVGIAAYAGLTPLRAVRFARALIARLPPAEAFSLLVLVLFALQLGLPRIKEYSYSLLAVLAAYYLLSRRRFDGTALALATLAAIPMALNHPYRPQANLLGGYAQLYCATAMFALMVWDFIQRNDQPLESAAASTR